MAAVKAVLLYATALAGLRLGTRRALAQMSPFDFVAAVAMGAIIGRAATASRTSFVTAAAAVLALIAVHRLIGILRQLPQASRLTDYRVRILVAHGHLHSRQLWLCELTRDDLYAELRRAGVTSLAEVEYVLYEHGGALTIVRRGHDTSGDVLTVGLHQARPTP